MNNMSIGNGAVPAQAATISPNTGVVPQQQQPYQAYQGGYSNNNRRGPGVGGGFNNNSFTNFNQNKRGPYNNGGGYNPSASFSSNTPPKHDMMLNEWGRPAADWGKPLAPDDDLEKYE
jgi:hypothetical protein